MAASSSFPSNDKSMEGLLRDMQVQIDEQSRRGLPGRLQTVGTEVTDWNQATDVGFYWGAPDIPNGPGVSGSSFTAVVYYDGNTTPTRLVQEARIATTGNIRITQTWRRVYAGGAWTPWYEVGSARVITDWNAASEPGLYTSASGASNSPDSGQRWVGQVYNDTTGALIQEVRCSSVASTAAEFNITYRRRWSGSAWSPWFVITGGDTGWQNITLAAGWSGVSPQYRVRNGRVEFRGEVYGGTDATTIFTMPVGARPISRTSYLAPRIVSNTVPAVLSLNIQTNGVCTGVAYSGAILTGSPGYSLGAFSYSAD